MSFKYEPASKTLHVSDYLDEAVHTSDPREHEHLRVQHLGIRVCGSGFGVQGAGFRVWGPGFSVCGSGFRVEG